MKTANFIKCHIFLMICVLACFSISGCSKDTSSEDELPNVEDIVNDLTDIIWSSSPFAPSSERMDAVYTLQQYLDECKSNDFKSYFDSKNASEYHKIEKESVALCFYKKSFDKVKKEVAETHPAEGEVYYWLLYNMGYVIKTSKVCFGIDIQHKYATELADNLDFLLTTHHHTDHYSIPLMKKMNSANKEIAANADFSKEKITINHYLKNQFDYLGHFQIKGFSDIHIHTFSTNHKHKKLIYVSTFEVALGPEANHHTFMHVGDSQYMGKEYLLYDKENIKVFISKYGVDNNAVDNETSVFTSVVKPKYVLYSHFNELGHIVSASKEVRWTYPNGFNRIAGLNIPGVNIVIPVWGDKMIWRNGDFVH